MRMKTYGHDYMLLWPAEIFSAEARSIAKYFNLGDIADAGTRLLEEALSGPQPVRDFGACVPRNRGWTSENYDQAKLFLSQLAADAATFPTHRRRYWAVRGNKEDQQHQELSPSALRTAWLEVVTDMDSNGYLDRLVPSACADGPNDDERREAMTTALTDRAGVHLSWPPNIDPDHASEERFFTYVEVLHDCVARPRRRQFHDYGQDFHYDDFAPVPGQQIYRWRVNALLSRTTLDLRLAEEGDDVGLLVHATELSRADLVTRVLSSVDDPAEEPAARAIARFRGRDASRLDKKEACRALAHELEPLRERIQEHLLSGDEKLLFESANRFAIRHNRADQHDDYADEYLDWLFWVYLSTVELMRRLAARSN
jgi:hypothetical protein